MPTLMSELDGRNESQRMYAEIEVAWRDLFILITLAVLS